MKRKLMRMALCLVLLASMLIAPMSAQAASTYKIFKLNTNANLRNPANYEDILTYMKKGTKVLWTGKKHKAFYLVSTTKPTQSATVSASSTLTWLKETRQYSPVNSTEFQHMIGALIYTKDVSTSVTTQPATEGSLSVTKNVEGEENSTTAFKFNVTLSDTSINGTYGAMDFTNGVATFELRNGEAAVAEHLPAGVTYTVAEEANGAYTTTWDGQTGSIVAEKTVAATCTNTLKPTDPTPAEPTTTDDDTTEETKPASDTTESKPAPKQPAAVPDTGDSTNNAPIVGLAIAGAAALSIACAQHIGEILVEHLHVVNKIIETAAVLKPVPTHHAMVLYLDFPAVHLGLLQKVDKAVLVVAVIVEGELKGFTGGVHARLGQIQPTVP